MGTTTHKIKTSMRGFKKWMDAHPRKKLSGYFSLGGRDMTDADLKAKQLKEASENVPDDAEVCVDNSFVITKLSDIMEYDEYNNRFLMAIL